MTLEEIILKAIPINYGCIYREAENKVKRILFEQDLKAYIANQLKFNARRSDIPGVDGNERAVQGVQN